LRLKKLLEGFEMYTTIIKWAGDEFEGEGKTKEKSYNNALSKLYGDRQTQHNQNAIFRVYENGIYEEWGDMTV
jgi:hypothetical protein